MAKETANNGKRSKEQAANARQKRKMIIFAVEIVVILAMVGILYLVMNETTETTGPMYTSISEETKPEEIGISEEVQQMIEEGGKMTGYLNVALFGLDALSNKPEDLLKNYRSDSTIIASINLDNGEIKLCSLYRDTYLNLGNDSYTKCNAAYAKGGAIQAISMMNSNLDLDISNWIAVSYQGLREVIDGLGGVYVDVDSEEIKHINNYQISIAEILKCQYKPVTETGYQLLDGLQAAAYCRIRYTAGDDFKRTERQREVIKAMADQAYKSDLATLTNVFTTALSDIYTSIDTDTILDLLANLNKYKIVEEGGFPTDGMRTVGTIGAKGSCVIPLDLESNVIWLHEFLFGDTDYQPSATVQNNSKEVEAQTKAYVGTKASNGVTGPTPKEDYDNAENADSAAQ